MLGSATPLHDALQAALCENEPALARLTDAVPRDRRDRALALLTIYDVHTAPLERIGEAARWQHHPALAALKSRLEQSWRSELDATELHATVDAAVGAAGRTAALPVEPIAALRALAARDRLPAAYRWLAKRASWPEAVDFLALEGGPDGGFDDLVALCQVGLSGSAKLELARNYWDELGNGDPARVHTVLYEDFIAAVELPTVPRADQPVEALERAALGGLLATNRWLQPEMLGALGLIELQAGPRCRLVLQAFDRLGAPAGAYPFYREHAEVDPRHGKDWLEHAIAPLVVQRPEWGARIVRGAAWRSAVNAAFFAVLRERVARARVAAA